MTEISPEDADRILEAAAAGRSVEGHEQLSDLLVGLHSPEAPGEVGTAPAVGGAGSGLILRMTRRTAVAASVAVLAVAGVAAATTAGVDVLDSVLGDEDPVLIVDEDESGETGPDEGTEDESSDDDGEADDGSGEVELADDGDSTGDEVSRHDPVDGVDPSDGLNTDELVRLCDAAVNHGHYVSSVAHDRETDHDGTHGSRVSAEAGTECGKDGDDPTDGDDPDEASDVGGDDDDRPGNGNGNAYGHDEDRGNGNGRGHDEDRGNGRGHGRGNG